MPTPPIDPSVVAQPTAPGSPTRAPHPLRAAITMLAAVAVFSLMDAGLKLLSGHYSPLQVAAIRGAASLPFVVAWVLVTGQSRSLWRVRWSLHLLRALLGITMMTSFVFALSRLPLATVYSIFFVAPLLVTAMSVPLLREHVGPRRWTAIGIGLLGVVVLLRPSGDGLISIAALATLLAASCYAVSAISVRVLSRTDSTAAMMVWSLAMLAVGAGLLALPGWQPILASDGWTILGVGVAGALGQYALTEAFRIGEASAIAPLEYTALVWGVLLDVALWGVVPDAVTWVGAGIIVVSGLYLLRRERVHAQSGQG